MITASAAIDTKAIEKEAWAKVGREPYTGPVYVIEGKGSAQIVLPAEISVPSAKITAHGQPMEKQAPVSPAVMLPPVVAPQMSSPSSNITKYLMYGGIGLAAFLLLENFL